MNKEEIKREIKKLLKTYKRMDGATRKRFEELGFRVEYGAKHYKIYFKENRNDFLTLSVTPSDGRSRMNAASHACRIIEIGGR